MPACMVIADAPETFALDGDVATSEVQIAKTGKFKDPRYGDFSITTGDFAKWISNFKGLVLGQDKLGLPVDVDHSPEKKGTTEAAGWVTELEARSDELWATVAWNTLGRELVGDRRYAYLSPSYQHDFKDEQGKSHGTALVGVALTNRPFLTMATVSLSAVAFDAATEVSDSPRQIMSPELRTKLIAKFSLATDATDEVILAAVEAAEEPKAPDKTLDALAADEGKVVLSADAVASLTADATAGRKASDALHAARFEGAFTKALSEGKVTPAEKDAYVALYGKAPEETITALDARPEAISLSAAGDQGAGGAAVGTDGSAPEGRESVDEDRMDLHNRALQLAADRKIDYADAVHLAAQEG